MKNKRGFTLVELLAVIVILALIALIVTPIMIGVIEDAESGAAETSAGHFIKAVNNEIVRQEMKGNPIEDGEYVLTEDGALCSLTDVKYSWDGKKVSSSCEEPIKIEVSGSNPTAGTIIIMNNLVADGSELTIKKRNVNIINGAGKVVKMDKETEEKLVVGTAIKYDPVTNTKCTTGGTCYDWYVLENQGEGYSFVSLIMNKNLDGLVAWISAEDYAKSNSDNTSCSKSACIDEGPVTAMNYLRSKTSDWTVYTTMPTFSQIRKAVVPQSNEIQKNTAGNSGLNISKASWLYENLGAPNTNGYWTYDEKVMATTPNIAWEVRYNDKNMTGRDVTLWNYTGVRPVIKVLKENLK